MHAQTFADAFKKSVTHWKIEVTASFVMFILEYLLEVYQVKAEKFHDELKLRFDVVRICYFNHRVDLVVLI